MKWNLDSVRLEILLILAQDRCIVWGKHTTWKSFWAHLMEPLGDLGQIEACFDLFGHSVNLDARQRHGLRPMCNRLENCFGHPMELSGHVGQGESCFDPFGDRVNLSPR
jgi:hypothetical protein